MALGITLETKSIHRGPDAHPIAMFPLLILFFGFFNLLIQRLNKVTVIRKGGETSR